MSKLSQEGQVIKHLTNFKEYKELISTSPCVVKFTAEWCGPCKRIGPTYTRLATEHNETINFLEINIDKASEITNFEDVRSIPLFVFYNNNDKLDDLRIQGANDNTLVSNVEEFVKQVNLSHVQTVIVPSTELDMSRLVLDDTESSFKDENSSLSEEDDTDEYGEDCDLPIEKTIPEDMIKEN